MYLLLELASTKNHLGFVKEILGTIPNYHIYENKLKSTYDEPTLNILDGGLFVVVDLNTFISGVENKGYVINGGPQ